MNTNKENESNVTESVSTVKTAHEEAKRDTVIVRTSIIGILANVFLAAFKATVGMLTHSIAIVLDAVNNLTDAISSVITIVGTKFASKNPDKKHPFGYGRIEYLSAMIIAVLVLYAGVTSLTESVKKIFDPDTPDYNVVSLIIVAVAVIVKIVLGKYVKFTGEKVNSDSLINSGKDAWLDSVISASTLVAAGIFIWKGFKLEAYLGSVIALVIIKSGFDMLKETLSKVLGESADPDLVRTIKKTVLSFDDVSGVYDLVLNNYGPDAFNGSVHIEIPDTYSVNKLDELVRAITEKVYAEHGVYLTAIGFYTVNTQKNISADIRDRIYEYVMSCEYVTGMHGFYVNPGEDKKVIRFDVVVSFDASDREAVYNKIHDKVHDMYPDYKLMIALDTDFSEK